jgi:hypothetical protein
VTSINGHHGNPSSGITMAYRVRIRDTACGMSIQSSLCEHYGELPNGISVAHKGNTERGVEGMITQ